MFFKEAMLKNRNNTLEVLDFSENSLGSQGLKHIAEFVNSSAICKVKHLNISNCKLKGKSLEAFAKATF